MKKKIAVAMSGGVDSSVVAALLAEQGHEVLGITANLYEPEDSCESKSKTCCSTDDIADAKNICKQIGIPHRIVDHRSLFDKEVVFKFSRSWESGLTPNPCVDCNQKVKFGSLLNEVLKAGYDYMATGHYTRIIDGELHRGTDSKKDQSYFCYAMSKDARERSIFPLGEMTKDQVRDQAIRLGLPTKVASKKESMDVCFVGKSYKNFLESELGSPKPGPVVDTNGNRVSTHEGLWSVTVGQKYPGLPLKVLKKIKETNTIIVGHKPTSKETVLHLTNYFWSDAAKENSNIEIQIRHRGKTIPGKIVSKDQIVLFTDEMIAPGQHAVAYDQSLVLGGGQILRVDI